MKIINIKIYVLLSMFLFVACSSYESRKECLNAEMRKLKNIDKEDRASALREAVRECKQYPRK